MSRCFAENSPYSSNTSPFLQSKTIELLDKQIKVAKLNSTLVLDNKENLIINNYNIPDPNWVSGFISGEGCFMIEINKSKSTKTGYAVNLRIAISQHSPKKFFFLKF